MNKKELRRRNRNQSADYASLETRNLLAGISFDPAAGVITVMGSAKNDYVQVSQTSTQLTVTFHHVDTKSFDSRGVNEIVFLGQSGDDWFKNETAISARAYGDGGNDFLIGGSNSDKLIGGAGDDLLVGGNGEDILAGNEGSDRLLGNGGDDQLLGGSGNDRLVGGSGNDTMFGEQGDDSLFGIDGDDWMSGGDGDDIASGDRGKDRILGEQGNDRIWGGDDDDILSGNDGDDSIFGGNGDDRVNGDAGNDRLLGNSGIDTVFGDFGDDILFGGNDDDSLHGSSGKDIVNGGNGNDSIFGDDDSDYLNGEDGHDRIYAGNGDDILRGGPGRDAMFGQNGADDLDGELDNDDLSGGPGSDRMRGGLGNDDYDKDGSDSVSDDSDDYADDDDFELRGTVTDLDTTAMTFSLLGINVDYSSAYVEHSFANGSIVEVEGSYDGSTLTAKEVDTEDHQGERNFDARGTLSNLDASAQTFDFHGFVVDYSNARVEGILTNGASVEVEGTLTDSRIAANKVESSEQGDRRDDSNHDDRGDDRGDRQSNGSLELRGAISNLSSSLKTFTILGVTVNYSNAETRGELVDGAFFKVEGQYDGSQLLAREVETERDDNRNENIEARGVISNLDPNARSFTLLGFSVDYSNAKVDGDLSDGLSVAVEGRFDGSTVKASEIKS